jgi:DNA-binding transcriptional MerR regulator
MNTPTQSPEIPDKLFFRIGEVSRIAGVPASVLRFWEGEFSRISPRRTDSGQRMYRRRDVELILQIKRLLYEKKFTIKGARQHLKVGSAPPAPKIQPELIDEIKNELEEIRHLLK